MRALLAILLAGSAQAGIISGGGPSDALSAATAAGTYVQKAGDTMTGRLTAPDLTLTYGLSAATAAFSGSVTVGSMTTRGANSGILVENSAYGELIKAGSGSNRIGIGVNAGGIGYCGGVYVGGTLGATFCNGGLRLGSTVTNPPANTLIADAVGIGTASPATTLDVNGNAQFGSGAAKSTFTATGFWEPYSRTRAQIDTLVPTKVGQVIYASDTTLPGLCVSTGTAAAQWRKMESATLGCGTGN